MVSGVMFKSLIHFELIFVNGVRQGSNFIFSVCSYPVFPPLFIEETILSPLSSLDFLSSVS